MKKKYTTISILANTKKEIEEKVKADEKSWNDFIEDLTGI